MSGKPRILVVDDDRPILTLMENILRQFDFEPRVASSGIEAMEIVRNEPPDLILLDLNMPGMDGEEVIGRLRGSGEQAIPIIIVSGEPLEQDEMDRLGAIGAVQKPFDLPGLISLIQDCIGQQGRR